MPQVPRWYMLPVALLLGLGALAFGLPGLPVWPVAGPVSGHPLPVAFVQMVHDSAAVVEVVVDAQATQYDAQDDMVYTFSTVRVERRLHGALSQGARFAMRIRGGRDGAHVSQPSEVMPVLAPGSRHVLFLKWLAPPDRPDLQGWYLTRAHQSRAQVLWTGRLRLTAVQGNLLAPWESKSVAWLRSAVMQAAGSQADGR